MEMLDEAPRESLPDSSVSPRNPVSAVRTSTVMVVVPVSSSQNDSATLLLQFQLPCMAVDNITVRLMQDKLPNGRDTDGVQLPNE